MSPPRLPPRREPRALAVHPSSGGLLYAVADPWELRIASDVACRARTRSGAITRLVKREKATLLVTEDPKLQPLLERAGRRLGVGVIRESLPSVPPPIASDLYPELPSLAPTAALAAVARVAIAAVLFAAPSSRRYAPRRHRAPERPR